MKGGDVFLHLKSIHQTNAFHSHQRPYHVPVILQYLQFFCLDKELPFQEKTLHYEEHEEH